PCTGWHHAHPTSAPSQSAARRTGPRLCRRRRDRQQRPRLQPLLHRNPVDRLQLLLLKRNPEHLAPACGINPFAPDIRVDELPLLLVPAVHPRARPDPVVRALHHACIHRISLDVPQ
ncbi:MAG: hypothetical protein ACK56F_26390, partial [bacterium]